MYRAGEMYGGEDALQNAAPGRWTTTTRAIVENLKILKKMDDFLGFFNFVNLSQR
jgi:hypothetical protein